MLITYTPKKFNAKHQRVIDQANQIIEEYRAEGYDLTLRQLYYQFVSRDLIPNTQREYKNLGSIINDARLAGEISWEAIIDRTRNLQKKASWSGPKEIVESCALQFRLDRWSNQENRVEVWIEKDALIGVIADVCARLDVPYFSCRGYTSQSEMWSAGQRIKEYIDDGKTPYIIHLGDHDPSGIDMSRDIEDRLALFTDDYINVNRIALNMNQVRQFNPPPNPAKITDTRAKHYIATHGNKSWELDALEPRVLSALVEKTVLSYRNQKFWDEQMALEAKHKKTLDAAAKRMK